MASARRRAPTTRPRASGPATAAGRRRCTPAGRAPASMPSSWSGLIIGLRMNADRSAESRRCSSSGRCVQAVTRYESLNRRGGSWRAVDLAIRAARVLPGRDAPLEVLADVVQVQVDGRRVAARDPVLGRRVEQQLHRRAVQGVALDELLEELIHLMDHPNDRRAGRPRARSRSGASLRAAPSPVRATRLARARVHSGLVAPRPCRHRRHVWIPVPKGPTHAAIPVARRLRRGGRVRFKPIEGVGTAVAAFVGLAARGPANQPTLVTNWSQFTQTFGEFMEGSYLAHAVYGYFLNGGGAAYVVRVGADGAMPAAQAELGSAKDKDTPAYRATALEAGPGRQRHHDRHPALLGDLREQLQARRQPGRQARSRSSTTSRPRRARTTS